MDSFAALVAPIAAVGALYVVAPVMLDAYSRFRGTKQVTCPETGGPAEIRVDAAQAALTAALGPPDAEVRRCSRWPQRQHCLEQCVSQISAPVE
jgi:hypothetical protein